MAYGLAAPSSRGARWLADLTGLWTVGAYVSGSARVAFEHTACSDVR
jgi:hypothetical protein